MNEQKVRLRIAIRRAIDEALDGEALSEDWAASLYANLDEPPSDDEIGWEILRDTSVGFLHEVYTEPQQTLACQSCGQTGGDHAEGCFDFRT